MSNPCRLYPHCQTGLSAVVGCRARWLQISGDVVLDILHCVLYDPFWPGGFLLASSSGGSVDLDEAEVCEDWWPRYLAGTAGVAVAILFVATYVKACRTLGTCTGVAWKAKLHSCLACQQLKTIQGRSQSLGKP